MTTALIWRAHQIATARAATECRIACKLLLSAHVEAATLSALAWRKADTTAERLFWHWHRRVHEKVRGTGIDSKAVEK